MVELKSFAVILHIQRIVRCAALSWVELRMFVCKHEILKFYLVVWLAQMKWLPTSRDKKDDFLRQRWNRQRIQRIHIIAFVCDLSMRKKKIRHSNTLQYYDIVNSWSWFDENAFTNHTHTEMWKDFLLILALISESLGALMSERGGQATTRGKENKKNPWHNNNPKHVVCYIRKVICSIFAISKWYTIASLICSFHSILFYFVVSLYK